MSDQILVDIRQMLGYDEDDDSHDEEILAMPADEQFELYCRWNGLLGQWYEKLSKAVLEIYKER